MSMRFPPRRGRLLPLATLTALCVAGAAPAAAQPTGTVRSWSALPSAVALGTPLLVTPTDASLARGTLGTIDTQGLTLEGPNGRVAIAASAVQRIVRADARKRRVLRYGIPLGMLVGGVTMLVMDGQSSNPEPGQAFGMGAVLIGLPVGALPASAMPVRPLYEAPARLARWTRSRNVRLTKLRARSGLGLGEPYVEGEGVAWQCFGYRLNERRPNSSTPRKRAGRPPNRAATDPTSPLRRKRCVH